MSSIEFKTSGSTCRAALLPWLFCTQFSEDCLQQLMSSTIVEPGAAVLTHDASLPCLLDSFVLSVMKFNLSN